MFSYQQKRELSEIKEYKSSLWAMKDIVSRCVKYVNMNIYQATHVRNNFFKVYVRHFPYFPSDKEGDGEFAFIIANILVKQEEMRGKGLGMRLINALHQVNPYSKTAIESVNNGRLYRRLLNDGWKLHPVYQRTLYLEKDESMSMYS